MHIEKFTFNPIQENTFIASDDKNNAVIVDPGCYFKEEKEALRQYILKNNLTVKAILNTHAHLDHIMGNAFVKKEYGVAIYLHKLDVPTLRMAAKSAELYGMTQFEESPEPDIFLKEGELLQFGKLEFEVVFGPGHAPGHVAFYSKKDNLLLNGDILFKGSYGRVDLPGGNFKDLKHSITQKLFRLPDKTVVYTGHGEETTIGKEKAGNPILW